MPEEQLLMYQEKIGQMVKDKASDLIQCGLMIDMSTLLRNK
jgi:hypothetical protein